jgi:hypothetical protein
MAVRLISARLEIRHDFQRDAGLGFFRPLGPVRHEHGRARQVFKVGAEMFKAVAGAGGGALGDALHLLFGFGLAGIGELLAGGRVGPGAQGFREGLAGDGVD